MGLSAKCLAQGQSNTNAPEGLTLSGLWFLLHHPSRSSVRRGRHPTPISATFPTRVPWKETTNMRESVCGTIMHYARIISYTPLLTNRLPFHLVGTRMHTETNSLSFALSNMLCFSLFNLLGNSLEAQACVWGQKESECALKSCSRCEIYIYIYIITLV